ncbi:MAG: peptide ABC transporter substrate-binding protein [Pseudomonadota bacterium]
MAASLRTDAKELSDGRVHATVSAVLIALLLVVGLARPGLVSAQEVDGPVYKRGNWGDVESLDPHQGFTIAEFLVLQDLFEGLTAYDAAGRIVAGAAESWTVSDDGLRYRFRLREGARWSDGEPVLAQDFARSFARALDPATAAPYATRLFPIRNAEAIAAGERALAELGVETPGPHDLVVTLERPTPYILESLAHMAAMPVRADAPAGAVVSNGPYRFVSRRPGDMIVLERNPHFHAVDDVAIGQVHYLPFADADACARQFQAGDVHSCATVPAGQFDALKARLGDEVRAVPSLTTVYLTLNLAVPPLDDARVRRALSLVIDRDFLAREIWPGAASPLQAWLPPGVDNYADVLTAAPRLADAELSMLEREDAALALMREAGYGPDRRVPLRLAIFADDTIRRTAVAVADMWRVLGIEVNLESRDFASHFGMLRGARDFDVAFTGWIADSADPRDFLALGLSDNTAANYGGYTNPDFDALVRESDAQTDPRTRAQLLAEAETILLTDLPNIPLLTAMARALVSPRLDGWVDNARQFHPSRYLSLPD